VTGSGRCRDPAIYGAPDTAMKTVMNAAEPDAVEPERDQVAMLEVAGQKPQRDHQV
jgi:hypothetical protein